MCRKARLPRGVVRILIVWRRRRRGEAALVGRTWFRLAATAAGRGVDQGAGCGGEGVGVDRLASAAGRMDFATQDFDAAVVADRDRGVGDGAVRAFGADGSVGGVAWVAADGDDGAIRQRLRLLLPRAAGWRRPSPSECRRRARWCRRRPRSRSAHQLAALAGAWRRPVPPSEPHRRSRSMRQQQQSAQSRPTQRCSRFS